MLIVGTTGVESKKIPIVTVLLIIATVAFFVKSYALEITAYNDLTAGGSMRSSKVKAVQQFFDTWGFQISDFKNGEFHSVITNIFVHAGFAHILGNMLAFWAFAIALEELLGGLGFVVFYIGCGIISCISQGVFLMESDIPIVGASGAVAAMMGSYAVLLGYKAKVKVLIWFFGPRIINIPAPIFAGLWIFPQLIEVSEKGVVDGGGVALISHIAGFFVGGFIGAAMKKSFNSRICEQQDGTIAINSVEKNKQMDERELLDEILAMSPFSEVVETLARIFHLGIFSRL